jgi:hypothetical protein
MPPPARRPFNTRRRTTTRPRRRQGASTSNSYMPHRASRNYAPSYTRTTDINVVTPAFPNSMAGHMKVKRYCSNEVLFTSSTTLEVDLAFYFSLDGLAGYTDFTNLFDQYRITSVIIEGIPTTSDPNGQSIIISPDYDDATSTSYSTLLQYSSAVRVPWGRTFTIAVPRPAVDASVYATGSSTRVALNQRSPWIDCGATDVQHFGLKLASLATPTVQTVRLQAAYIIEFRQVR